MKTQLKKQLKRVIPVTVCTSIALISTAFADEIISYKSAAIAKNKVTEQPATEKKAPAVDPAITAIEKEILTPVRLQEQVSHSFSRSRSRRSNSYQLVETSSNKEEGARYFDILVTTNDSFKLIIIKKLELESDPVKVEPKIEPKIEPKSYLKLKYLTASNKVLIQQNHEWVEKSKHKYLKHLPVTVNKR